MKLFELHRDEDVHGNSGTGIVAQGVEFDSGFVAFTWLSHFQTVTTATSMRVVDGLHSHEGRTKVVDMSEKYCRELLATLPEETVRAILAELQERFESAQEEENSEVPESGGAGESLPEGGADEGEGHSSGG